MRINKELLKFVRSNKRKDLHRKFSVYAGNTMEFDIDELKMDNDLWSPIIIYRKRIDSGSFYSYSSFESKGLIVADDFIFPKWKLLF